MDKLIPISKKTSHAIVNYNKFYNLMLILARAPTKINKLEYSIYYDVIKIEKNKWINTKTNYILHNIILYIKTYLPLKCYNLIYESVLKYQLNEAIESASARMLKLTAVNYNILRIMSGMGSLSFSI